MSLRKVRDVVIERDEGRCMIAGPHCLGVATEPDHRANRGAGGSKALDGPECVIAACGLCNGWKTTVSGDARAELERRGVIVLKAATNAETARRCREKPLIDPWGAVWFLLPDGRRVLCDEPTF